MKVTVCELPNTTDALHQTWEKLVVHVNRVKSELVLLPEMPFFRWLSHSNRVTSNEWEEAMVAHDEWIDKISAMEPAIVASTRPVLHNGKRQNLGYIWEASTGFKSAHTKYYLPDESGFWEASVYQRGNGSFIPIVTSKCKIGFLICTELWFNHHAREYGKQDVDVIVCPRATPNPSADKWVAGGRTAAVVSGAFCLSSNLSGTTAEGCDFAGASWIIEPEEGQVLGLTTKEQPFLTIDINLEEAVRAKKSYPRYVLD